MKKLLFRCFLALTVSAGAYSRAWGQKYIASCINYARNSFEFGKQFVVLLESVNGAYTVRDSIPMLADEFGLQLFVTDSALFVLCKSRLTSGDSLLLTRYAIRNGRLTRDAVMNLDKSGQAICPSCLFMKGRGASLLDCGRGEIVVDLDRFLVLSRRP
jgi:hypothetical protein